jgi:hypothetical protein
MWTDLHKAHFCILLNTDRITFRDNHRTSVLRQNKLHAFLPELLYIVKWVPGIFPRVKAARACCYTSSPPICRTLHATVNTYLNFPWDRMQILTVTLPCCCCCYCCCDRLDYVLITRPLSIRAHEQLLISDTASTSRVLIDRHSQCSKNYTRHIADVFTFWKISVEWHVIRECARR